MPHVTFRVSEQEKEWMESYAKVRGVNLSDLVKDAVFEKLEDEYDLQCVREYEQEKEHVFYSMDEVKAQLGLNDEEI